jgi:hypothetical protein
MWICIQGRTVLPLNASLPFGRFNRALFPSTTPRILDNGKDPSITAPVDVLKKVEACVAATGDQSSRFDRLKMLPDNKTIYVFRVDGPRCCPYGHHHNGRTTLTSRWRGKTYCTTAR